MTRTRFVAATIAAFLVSQILAVVVHGVILAADYAPFYGTLLRPMSAQAEWRMLLLPIAHVCFVMALVWLSGRIQLEGSATVRGLKLGLVGFFLGHLPHALLSYAEQPWSGSLIAKQIGLELLSSLLIGVTVAAVARRARAPSPVPSQPLASSPG